MCVVGYLVLVIVDCCLLAVVCDSLCVVVCCLLCVVSVRSYLLFACFFAAVCCL